MSQIVGGRKELVWRNGVNETDMGPMVWNDRARKSVMEIYKRRGNPVLLDLNHNYNEDERPKWEVTGQPAPTAGNGILELDAAGNLWVVPQWSTLARQRIDGNELRFLSPDFAFDKKTKEILEIYRISLVAEPGTWRARMVANANRKKGRLTMGISAELIAAIQEMASLMESEQVSDALKTAVSKVVAMAGGGDAMPAAEEPLSELAAGMPKPDAESQRFAASALRMNRERATLAARRLCDEKRADARDRLKLLPAEEKSIAGINDPAELDRALGILSATREAKDAGKATLGREPAIERGPQTAKPSGNKYIDALAKHGYAVEVSR